MYSFSFLFFSFFFLSWNPFKAGSICDPSLSGKYQIHNSASKNCVLINQTNQPDPCRATYVLFSLYRVCLFVDSVILIEAMYIFMICLLNKRFVSTKINEQVTIR
jgi:hypothetical protein